jgi:hypothetical protein
MGQDFPIQGMNKSAVVLVGAVRRDIVAGELGGQLSALRSEHLEA